MYEKLDGYTPQEKLARLRLQQKAWRQKNKEYVRQKERERYQLFKDSHKDVVKVKAREALRWQVRSGKIERGACESCGESEVQAHHPDHSKPLSVIWLCASCHRIYHFVESRVEALKKAKS